MKVSADVITIWYEVYMLGDDMHTDKHTAFSKRVGLPRQEAKELCYKLLYTVTQSDLMKNSYNVSRKI